MTVTGKVGEKVIVMGKFVANDTARAVFDAGTSRDLPSLADAWAEVPAKLFATVPRDYLRTRRSQLT